MADQHPHFCDCLDCLGGVPHEPGAVRSERGSARPEAPLDREIVLRVPVADLKRWQQERAAKSKTYGAMSLGEWIRAACNREVGRHGRPT